MATDAIKAKISALLSKTVENGCTEAEMLSAMTKARALMEQHGLTEDQLKVETDKMSIEQFQAKRKFGLDIGMRLTNRLAKYCDVIAWFTGGTKNPEYHVYGTKADKEFFAHLVAALGDYVDRAGTDYSKAQVRKAIELGVKPSMAQSIEYYNSFTYGATVRINERLAEEIEKRKGDVKMSDGRGLVVVKAEMVKAKLADEHGIHLGKGKAVNPGKLDANSYHAGRAAGDAAGFGRPLGGRSSSLAIGN